MNITPRWVKVLRNKSKYFDIASQSLETLWHARGGGKLDIALASVSVLGKAIDNIYPRESAWRQMKVLGLRYEYTSISELICKELLKENTGRQIIDTEDYKGYVWDDENGKSEVGVLVERNGPSLFLSKNKNGFNRLSQELRSIWQESTEISLSKTMTGGLFLNPMDPPGPYWGKRRPEWYANRLENYSSGPRTILLRGPTGVGKSVLARHISKCLGNEGAKTLKISSLVLNVCDEDEIVSLVRYLQPTVLLLDDLELNNELKTAMFLSLLETIRDPNCLIIVTMMTHHRKVESKLKKGCWHFPGMRPGRIDEIFTLYLPDKEERTEILTDYFKEIGDVPEVIDEIAEATEGLSGAYLKSVVERISCHGLGSWKDEVDNVFYTAPAPKEESEDTKPQKTTTAGEAKIIELAGETEVG